MTAELLPTPTAAEYGTSNNGCNAGRPSTGKGSLNTMARRGLLPTPSTGDARGANLSGRDPAESQSLRSLSTLAARGLLPTPTAMDHRDTSTTAVAVAAQKGQQVRLAGAVKLIPTPTAADSRSARNCTQNGGAGSKKGNDGTTLTDWLYVESGTTPPSSSKSRPTGVRLRLNPAFVEHMMGFPPGWTDVL